MRAVLLLIVLLPCVSPGQQPANPDQLLKSAISAQQRGDFQTAIRDYRSLLQLRPGEVEAKVNLGAALAHVGQFDAAIAEYKEALPAIAQKTPILINIGLAYYKKGDFKNAHDQFEAVHLAQPEDVRTAILLGDTDVHLGDAKAAVSLLEPLQAANSDNGDFNFVLGAALIGSGQRNEGVQLIQKVADTSHGADAYFMAGVTLLQMNEYQKSRADLDAALALDPKLPHIYTLAGTAHDKTGDVAGAESDFREALKLDPDDFDANLYVGAILYKRRQLDDARPYLEKAVKLNPASPTALYESGMLKSTSGDYAGAVVDLEKVAKDDPGWLDPHVELASLYYKLHRPADGARERQTVDRLTAEQQASGPGKP